jgi:drug/metabolite transporter (DMT)-like permease
MSLEMTLRCTGKEQKRKDERTPARFTGGRIQSSLCSKSLSVPWSLALTVAHLSFALLCLIWGSSFILIERARHAFGPIDVALGRVAGGAVVMGLVWWLSRNSTRIAPRDWLPIACTAFVGTVIPFAILSYCIAPGRFGHSYFGMLMALVPIATIMVSVPMLRVWPTTRQMLGVVGGLACIVLLAQVGDERGMPAGLIALALVVPLGYAIGNTMIKWKLSHLRSAPLTTLLLALASVMLLPLEFMPGRLADWQLARPAAGDHWPLAIASLAILGAVSTGFAIWLFNQLIVARGPLFAGMVTYVFPLVALAWGHFDGEPITPRQLAAMAGVLAMVAVVQFGGVRPTRRAAAVMCPAEASLTDVEAAPICPAAPPGTLLESSGEPE